MKSREIRLIIFFELAASFAPIVKSSEQVCTNGADVDGDCTNNDVDAVSELQRTCTSQDMLIFKMNLYRQIERLSQNGKLEAMPIFKTAGTCIALENQILNKETTKSLKRMLKCWWKVMLEAKEAPAQSRLRMVDGSYISIAKFWEMKRLELLRDHTALSSIGGIFYKTLRLGLVNSSNVDGYVKKLRLGLEDPVLRCQSHWLQGFDHRDYILRDSLWKRYGELLIAMQMLGASELDGVFSDALKLPDNLQQWQGPEAIHAQFPGLRTSPFWEKAEFPWLLQLEERFQDIRAELLNANSANSLTPDPSDVLPKKQADDWQSLPLYIDGGWNEEVCETLTPITCGLLRGRPELDARNIQFSASAQEAIAAGGFEVKRPVTMVKVYKLQPGSFLRPHFGSHGRLAAHLGIVVPSGCCSLKVGGKQKVWEDGELFVFDDSFVHEAHNTGKDPRIVLGVFFVHPDLLASVD